MRSSRWLRKDHERSIENCAMAEGDVFELDHKRNVRSHMYASVGRIVDWVSG